MIQVKGHGPSAALGSTAMVEPDTYKADRHHRRTAVVRHVGMALGPALFLLTLLLAPPEGLAETGWHVAGLALWMAVWWISETVPLPATALLPIVVLPATSASTLVGATAPFGNPLIFLFLGGFLIALAVERVGFHRRIALSMLVRLPERPAMLVGGFMVTAAGLSMWVSNTATTLMMLPIALSVIALLRDDKETAGGIFPIALLLGLAYAASIGGVATLIGTPPNALVAAVMEENFGIHVGFATWMAVALPLSIAMLAVGWFILCRVVCRLPGGRVEGASAVIAEQHQSLGPMSAGEVRVAVVVAVTALLWITGPLIESVVGPGVLGDTSVAIGAAVVLFVLPSGEAGGGRLLDWESAKRVPWGVLILLGGGLSLAEAIETSGLAEWIGHGLEDLTTWPVLLITGMAVLIIVFLTEITSNTATSATFIPIAGALALTLGISPLDLAAPVAVAASCAFMLPVATPPNAIIYGSGAVTAGQMARAGFLINLAAVVLISFYLPWAIDLMFG